MKLRVKTLNLVLALAAVALCLVILPDYGMSWDEPPRWNGGDRKLAYYEHILGFTENPEAVERALRRDLYPGFFDLNLAWIRRLSPFSKILTSHAAYLFFGLAGVLGAALLAEQLRRGSGIWAALGLLFFPGYFGHMFINPKDIPFAAMYALSLCALVWFIRSRSRLQSWRRLLLFAVLAGLTGATRLPGLILFVYLGMVLLATVIIGKTRDGLPHPLPWQRRLGRECIRGAVACAIGFLVFIPWWPYLHQNPFSSMATAAGSVTAFSWDFPVLFFGEYIPADELPLSYLPVWVLFTAPLALFPVAVIALLQFLRWVNAFSAQKMPALQTALCAGVVLIAVVVPLAVILITNATLYNGLRHVLFLLPPVIALLAVGWGRWLDTSWPARKEGRRLIAIGVLALAYLPVVSAMIRLHPYQYAYFNELAGGVANASHQFESEYWGTSYKEAMGAFIAVLAADPANHGQTFVVNMEHPTYLARHYLPDDLPFTLQLVRAAGNRADFHLANTLWHADTWWAGEPIVEIKRMGAVFAVVKDRRQLKGAERVMYYGLQ